MKGKKFINNRSFRKQLNIDVIAIVKKNQLLSSDLAKAFSEI